MKKKPSDVVVALSGGIDSAFAATLLKDAGWKVIGLHFKLPTSALEGEERIKAVEGVARYLKIPLYVMDIEETFRQRVMLPFIESYLQGLTPNPCVICNDVIKFESLLRYAGNEGISYLATGHYARVGREQNGSHVMLLRGKDRQKEQSYFLHRLNQVVLSRSVFPMGDMKKKDVRRRARDMGLPIQTRPESQEICFLKEKDYRLFIERERGALVHQKGNIIDSRGHVLGEHTGAWRYTIGQRHGLGIASSHPYYVKEIHPWTNDVVVGRRENLYSTRVGAGQFNWIEGEPLGRDLIAKAQVRYRHSAAPGHLEVLSAKTVRFTFEEPQWAITPGQALVCYEGERVLGGGWIIKPDQDGNE